MPILHATAHRLQRLEEGEATLSLRERDLPIDDYCQQLLDRLKNGFLSRMSREHGSFGDEGDAPLPTLLDGLLTEEINFDTLARDWMERLRKAVDEEKCAVDGHFFFFLEKSFNNRHLYLFVAQRQESLSLDAELNLQVSHPLDFGASLYGIKVDLSEWKERGHYAYLSLIAPRGNPPLADLFYRLTGFGNGIDKGEATHGFLEGVEAFSQNLEQDQLNDYRNQVVDFCMERDQNDEPIDLRELSQQLDNIDRDAFVRTVADHSPRGEAGVMLDRRSLRRYVKFAGRERDLAISFSSFQLDNRVRYDANSDTLSINGIPRALRNQLLEHLGKD